MTILALSPLPRLVLIGLLAWAAARSAAAESDFDDDANDAAARAERAAEVRGRLVGTNLEDVVQSNRLRRELAAATDIVQVVYDLLIAEPSVPDSDAEGQSGEIPPPLDRVAEQLLFEALRSLPVHSVSRELFAEFGEEPSLDDRVQLARILGRLEDASAIELMLEVYTALDDVSLLRPYVRGGLREGIADILRTDPRAPLAIENELHGLDERLLPPVVEALATRPASETLPILERVLGRNAEIDRLVLQQFAGMDRHSQLLVGDEALGLSRRRLDHVDAAVRIQAVDVLGRLGDTDSFEELVGLLECAEPPLARAAHTALTQLSGRNMGALPDRWYAWYDAELVWFERSYRSAATRSRAADPGEASGALRELSEHRLLASDVLPVLLDALDHPEAGVVISACNALQRLDHPAGIPALVSLVGDHRPGVDVAVSGCLRALARESSVLSAQAWRAWLER